MGKVLKFGGTSIGSVDRVLTVLHILKHSSTVDLVVMSAFGGITNQLIQMMDAAREGDKSYVEGFEAVKARHLDIIAQVTHGEAQANLLDAINPLLNRLGEILRGVYLVRHAAPKTTNQILSYGERLSAQIMTAALNESGVAAIYLDTRNIVKTKEGYGGAVVDFKATNHNIVETFPVDGLAVVTGFIASNHEGETTTLGRSGSDYTAAIFGAALDTDEIEIWTDVDGILTANPHEVPDARSIPAMSYEDAMEMSHFGAKVIFPPTIQPAMQKDIPIRIRNTFNPDFPGTLIHSNRQDPTHRITGISSMDAISLIRIQGSGMIGKTGLTGRIFQVMARANVGVMLISLASSEHSICFAVDPDAATVAQAALQKEFALELQAHSIAKILIEDDLCIVAVVGDNMRHTPGIAGKVFNVLGELEVNVVAIAQGSSERNISIVIGKEDEVRVKQALHTTFFESTS